MLERGSHVTVRDAVGTCEKAGDFVSREIFVEILDDTEEHIDWLETQIELIDKISLPNYLQSQLKDGEQERLRRPATLTPHPTSAAGCDSSR